MTTTELATLTSTTDGPLALVVDPDGTRDDFRQVLANLNLVGGTIGWMVGDAMNAGLDRFGMDVLADIRDILTTYDDGTLANWSHVAGKFPADQRRTALTISHHLEVAYLDDHLAAELLDQAEAESFTTSQIRAARKALGSGDDEPTLPGLDDTDEPDDDGDDLDEVTHLPADPVPADVKRSYVDLVAPLVETNSPNILIPRALAMTLFEAYRKAL